MSGNSSDSPITAQDLLRGSKYGNASSSTGNNFDGQNPLTADQLFTSSNLSALHPLAAVSDKELDYLQLEDDRLNQLEGSRGVLPSRGWGDELCYGTGSTYLSGLAAGGLWGLREGLTRPIYRSSLGQAAAATGSIALDALGKVQQQAATAAASAAGNSTSQPARPQMRMSAPLRLRLNTVLNAMTSRGTFVGNNAGVLALIYNGINCTIDKYRGQHDIYGSMVAGAGTGAIWRSTAGLRPMIIASALMTAGAASWTSVKKYII